MNTRERLQKRLTEKNILVLDGAMGTEILHHGVATTLPLWSAQALLTHPQVVQRIHEEYVKAGADILITDTFRTTPRAFAKVGRSEEEARNAAQLACRLARRAIEYVQPSRDVYVAGSIAPLEECYSPELTPPDDALEREHLLTAQTLKEGGVDFLLLETMITKRETLAAVRAAKSVGMPFAVSFCTNEQGNLLSGEPLEEVVTEVDGFNPLFIGVNCVSPAIATLTLRKLKGITSRPLSVYAQGEGMPRDDQGWSFDELSESEDYVTCARQWLQEGAQVVGGCCGTSPVYIERVRELVEAGI
ncbi:MAG TPA: homocysteine S-methyltransferase family protein [Ktedonobacteraceae bacterium]|nr:homocysteine S-methyltransferase family protein [Ktedonobacteraceae bacterium]